MLLVLALAVFAAWLISDTLFAVVAILSLLLLVMVGTGSAAAIWSYKHGENLV